ncbi:hypothetical protein CC2G_009331 [Coprinopsis cinerea AmutBmut pab1-1]|nr:hypothetical protein CC2G_009331 [Coprinopsis cinerea AmutBmut pab1-1]
MEFGGMGTCVKGAGTRTGAPASSLIAYSTVAQEINELSMRMYDLATFSVPTCGELQFINYCPE